jgi:hypothetical protein
MGDNFSLYQGMKANLYQARLKHDHGVFTVKVVAATVEKARELICQVEGCPTHAIEEIFCSGVYSW